MSPNHAQQLGEDFLPLQRHASPAMIDSEVLRGFAELVADIGGNPRDLLRQNHIDPAVLRVPGSAVQCQAVLRVMQCAAEELSCPDFGLRLAAMQGGNESIGLIRIEMKRAKTVGQAIGYGAKHQLAAATRVRFEQDRAKQLVLVKLDLPLVDVADKRQAVEHALMLASLNILDLAGPAARVKRVLLSHMPLSPLMTYRSYFGCEVLFNQQCDGFVLTEKDLSRPVIEPEERLHDLVANLIDARYPLSEPPIQARVRRLILQTLGSKECTSEKIAGDLYLHPRTLQRRLRAERTSFEDIKDEVRREVALRYIHRSDIPLKRLAQMLGYAETSVLSRSCYRWFAASARQLRLRYHTTPPRA